MGFFHVVQYIVRSKIVLLILISRISPALLWALANNSHYTLCLRPKIMQQLLKKKTCLFVKVWQKWRQTLPLRLNVCFFLINTLFFSASLRKLSPFTFNSRRRADPLLFLQIHFDYLNQSSTFSGFKFTECIKSVNVRTRWWKFTIYFYQCRCINLPSKLAGCENKHFAQFKH